MSEISCIIPTHGRPQLLLLALESVRAQSVRCREVLVVDDLNDPATEDVVLAFTGEGGVAVRYVPNLEHPGACGSRNLGASLATGRYVAFLDDDDVWYPQFVERIGGRLATDDLDLVMTGLLRRMQQRSDETMATPEGLTAKTIFDQRVAMTGSNFVARKDAFLSVGGFDPSIPVFNDWDLFVRFIDADVAYGVVGEVLAEWREHAGDRITAPSVRRADGIDIFLARYGRRMPSALFQELKATAIGIRRRHARSPWERATLALQLARTLGATTVLRRALRHGR